MDVETKWGFPVVNAENIFQYLESVNIKPWPQIEPTVSLDEYLKRDLTDDQKGELRFAPKAEVMFLEQPNGQPYTAFRSTQKPWATTFCLLPGDLIPIVAEWKHGAECISLAPPSGSLGKADNGSMKNCAKREFEEETGIELSGIIPLSQAGIAVNCRSSGQRFFPHLGIAATPISPGPTKLDQTENISLVLIPLKDWLMLIEEGGVVENCSISTTLMALQYLQRLELK
ncbi:hypothetical protein C4546_04205 [Candidatus Parcubacteria bacterium]|jgi:hypothetical protein|nr:MAG: hypothetical protein C4546_04205 [Candidatus Parcubacteria bacterium]